MVFNPVLVASRGQKPQWYQGTAKYAQLNLAIAIRQLLNTLIPYFLLFALMVHLVRQGYPFQGAYWARHAEWDPWRAALEGASYYKMPKLQQWLTGNIGFHHVHHARPGIPNYHLQQCYEETPELQGYTPVTIAASLKSTGYHLWDAEQRQLVSFSS